EHRSRQARVGQDAIDRVLDRTVIQKWIGACAGIEPACLARTFARGAGQTHCEVEGSPQIDDPEKQQCENERRGGELDTRLATRRITLCAHRVTRPAGSWTPCSRPDQAGSPTAPR